MEKADFQNALRLSHVPRWVIVDMLKQQTVADHTFRVSVTALRLIRKLHLKEEFPNILACILIHDLDEAETGDVPSNHKTEMPKNGQCKDLQEALIKMADTIEATVWLERYGVRPGRIRRWLESKLNFLTSEINRFTLMPERSIMNIVNEIVEEGSSYD